ncbi:hypothetical protein HZ326_18569 [Fusarium oxysporum f. sp. albedinis]|nr:hypothetical protein HZ326_18569 [Fusarium oxysporum f. sp. albedinis]
MSDWLLPGALGFNSKRDWQQSLPIIYRLHFPLDWCVLCHLVIASSTETNYIRRCAVLLECYKSELLIHRIGYAVSLIVGAKLPHRILHPI